MGDTYKIPTEAELSKESIRSGQGIPVQAIRSYPDLRRGTYQRGQREGTFVARYDSKMIYPVLYGIIFEGFHKQIVWNCKVIDIGELYRWLWTN